MATFAPVDPKQHFPALEERVLAFWQEARIFEKSLGDENDPRPLFVFFEGPPTANGKPGIHHVLARSFKDVIPRYKTMRGFRVPRKAGWDCHGLPVEVEVEKRLGLKGKGQIEALGVAEFNRQCRASVFQYILDWDRMTARIGFWLDTEHPYRTLDNPYIESCWALLKQLWDRGLLAQNYKVTKHCPRCGTSLAEAEAGLGMKEDVDDPSVTVRLRLLPGQPLPFSGHSTDTPTSVLIWTTTPWTLPANAAAALHRTAPYALCERAPADGDDDTAPGERFLLLATQVESVLGKGARVLATAPGEALAGLRYEPLYPGVGKDGAAVDLSAAYRTLVDETVEIGEGTGIVHIAPAYGDLDVGRRHGLPVLFSVGLDGVVLPAFPAFAGKFFKDADPLITRDLKERRLLLHAGRIKHSYPFCWRCDAPLIYYAKTSWYIRTTEVREQMLAANQEIAWYPEHIKEGRFGDWLRNNVDWALSRERYWGTPLPLWQCDACAAMEFVGSVADLSARVGQDLSLRDDLDLHRPQVDTWTWPCRSCGTGQMSRIRDVIDCWFDSGAMPFAQHHFPFDHEADFGQLFPAEFISEGVDQTRGWFYTLHALGVLLRGGPAFKNCIVLGHILDDKGRKMSKRLGNIVDPWTVLNAEGADALRYYLYTASPPGQPRRFSQALVRQSLRQFLLTLWNCYSFFVTYAEATDAQGRAEFERLGSEEIPFSQRPVIDQWILGRLHRLIRDTTAALDRYDITAGARGVAEFVDELSNWYVRRNRDRFWSSLEGPEGAIDGEVERSKRAAYQTLHTCLIGVAQLLSPFTPFVAEELWQNLVRRLHPEAPESVHLSRWPEADEAILRDTEELLADMDVVLKIVALGRAARAEHGLKTRQPLQAVMVQLPSAAARRAALRFSREVREELNVEEVRLATEGTQLVSYTVRPNLPKLGKKYGRRLKDITAALQAATDAQRQGWAEAVLREEPVLLPTPEGAIELSADEVLLSSQSVEGFAAKAEGGVVVAIATEVTPELRDRGIAREVVRGIGELRKRAGCKVSDRVQVGYVAPGPVSAEALARHGEYVAGETLCALTAGELPGAEATGEVELDEGILKLSLKR
jgi:isoleucyl-tRNA synthetase